MSERILVGLNGSEPSAKALDWAVRRAKQRGAELVLVHIIDRGVGLFDVPELLLDAKERGKELLAKAEEDVTAMAPELQVTIELGEGFGMLESFIELSEDADLIVVGSDSQGLRSETRHRGTHSYRVAAGVETPVIVIPDIDVSDRRGVVVGIDGSDASAHALEYAAAEATDRGEPLIAVSAWLEPSSSVGREYVFTPSVLESIAEGTTEMQNEALRPIREKYPELEIERVVENNFPAEALIQRGSDAALVVVGSHGRGTFRRLLVGSVSHSVLGSLVAPTVVYR